VTRTAVVFITLASACGCAKPGMSGPTMPVDAGPTPPARASASASAPAPDIVPLDAGSPQTASTSRAPDVKTLDACPEAADPSCVDAARWLAERGVGGVDGSRKDRLYGCNVVTLGAPPREGLFCNGGPPMKGSLPSGHSLFPLTVWVVEKHALRIVLEVPIAAGPLDREEPFDSSDPNRGNYINLEPTLRSGGTEIEIREASDPKASCAAALAANADSPKHRQVIQAACRSAGRWTWRDGRFVREAVAPQPTSARGSSGP
jgi:hypothetical protein